MSRQNSIEFEKFRTLGVRPGSALASLEARIGLVDHIDPATAAHDTAILVPRLQGFQ